MRYFLLAQLTSVAWLHNHSLATTRGGASIVAGRWPAISASASASPEKHATIVVSNLLLSFI